MPTREVHRGARIGWLRAAVPGANDGRRSTASLIGGVPGATGAPRNSLVAGIAAYLSVRFLTRYFVRQTLIPFGVYCIVAGVAAFVLVR